MSTSGGTTGAGGFAVFGDGSDGKQIFDGTTTILGMVPSSSVYTQSRDLFLDDGTTLNSGVTLITNGFRIYCRGNLINNGSIGWNGNNAALSIAGAAVNNVNATINNGTSATLSPGTAGGAGATGNGSAASSPAGKSYGGAGGNGGAGATGTAGSGGTVTAPANNDDKPHAAPLAVLYILHQGSSLTLFQAGAGGGGGGGDATNAGGGGGGGGGQVGVYAKTIGGTGTISANGGNGAPGAAASTLGAGGGGGGGGGIVIIISESVVSGAITGQTITVNGGSGGAGVGAAGANGSNGSAGTLILLAN